jgi:hypothetical protein
MEKDGEVAMSLTEAGNLMQQVMWEKWGKNGVNSFFRPG